MRTSRGRLLASLAFGVLANAVFGSEPVRLFVKEVPLKVLGKEVSVIAIEQEDGTQGYSPEKAEGFHVEVGLEFQRPSIGTVSLKGGFRAENCDPLRVRKNDRFFEPDLIGSTHLRSRAATTTLPGYDRTTITLGRPSLRKEEISFILSLQRRISCLTPLHSITLGPRLSRSAWSAS